MSDKKKNKKTLVGVGKPTAEEIAADAEEKATKKAEEAKASAGATTKDVEDEAASVAAATNDELADPQEEASSDDSNSDAEAAAAKKSADDTRAETSRAKKKARESGAPKAAATPADSDESSAANDKPSRTQKDKKRADDEGMVPVDPPVVDAADSADRRPALYLAEYETPEALHHAACTVRKAGFEHWDCHTPYPVHGLDQAMGLAPTKIGIISFVHAVIGLTTAVLMIQYMNNWDYGIVVGGKPPGAFAPMVPIMFELTVLLTGFGTLFGLLHLAGLPRHHHPIFESDRFAKSTDDRFFISIEVKDPNFDLNKTRALLEGTDPSYLELVEEELV